LPGADLSLSQLFDPAEAQRWFERLQAEIPWEQHHIRLFGRQVPVPRLSCWLGDADAVYTYSGMRYEPHAWTVLLAELRTAVCIRCAQSYNSALCNLYRDGRDAMGWHSDDEPELGPAPSIASLSLGAMRRFRLRHRDDPAKKLSIDLQPGSVLLMAGATQRNYRHALPRTARAVGARINVTFRTILVDAASQPET
jgi:alkylated DNA repair dioxygenase AlkB